LHLAALLEAFSQLALNGDCMHVAADKPSRAFLALVEQRGLNTGALTIVSLWHEDHSLWTC
jgi:hypothetical protein